VVAVAAGLEVVVVQAQQVVGEEPEVHRHPRHDAAAVRAQQRAVVAGLDLGQVLEALLDAVRDRVQHRGPLRRRGARPGGEGLDRGRDAPVDLACRPRATCARSRPSIGRDVLERVRPATRSPADPVAGVDLDARRRPRWDSSVAPPTASRGDPPGISFGSERRTCVPRESRGADEPARRGPGRFSASASALRYRALVNAVALLEAVRAAAASR
jgi:hypothetical protein